MNLNLAKKRIAELQHFVDLVENYETVDFRSYVVKEYAITSSINKVVDKMNQCGFQVDNRDIIRDDVIAVINTKSSKIDELHKRMRSVYRKKLSHNVFLK